MKRVTLFLLCFVSLFAHAQVQINNLPAASAVAGTDLTIDDQSGVTRTATFSQVGTYIYANLPLLLVGGGGTGITSGTSGGIPYFSSASTMASSGLLTANELVLGGGAGGTPTVVPSLGTTTTVLHGNAAGAPSFSTVTLADQANLAANSIVGNNTGSPATPLALTTAQTKSLLAIANTDVSGLGTFATANSATPPAIGGTTPAAGTFTALTSTTPAANLASGLTQASNTSVDGLTLIDSTAASAANQQYSPRIRLTGQGWKTTATAASQTVDWIIENQPVQGTANPTSQMVFSSQINGGGYTANATLSNVAGQTLGQWLMPVGSGAAPSYSFAGNTNYGVWLSGTTIAVTTGGVNRAIFGGTNQFPSNSSFSGYIASVGTTFTIASGTGACATTSTLVGGAIAGNFTCTGTTGASTATLTMAQPATHAYVCYGRDVTTPTTLTQTGAISTTSVTLTMTAVVANDVIQFACPINY